MEIKHLEVLEMDNDEILCAGKTVGYKKDIGKYLHDPVRTKLVSIITDYESDTFSSSGSDIEKEEAVEIAEKLIEIWTDRNLDGVAISGILSEMRER